jgi:hypothetical protein
VFLESVQEYSQVSTNLVLQKVTESQRITLKFKDYLDIEGLPNCYSKEKAFFWRLIGQLGVEILIRETPVKTSIKIQTNIQGLTGKSRCQISLIQETPVKKIYQLKRIIIDILSIVNQSIIEFFFFFEEY